MKNQKRLMLWSSLLAIVVIWLASNGSLSALWESLTASLGGYRPAFSTNITHLRDLVDSTGAVYGTVEVSEEDIMALANNGKMAIDDPNNKSAYDADGVIVKFKLDPTLKVSGREIANGKTKAQANATALAALSNIKNEHSRAILAIEKKLGKSLDFSGKKVKGKIRAVEYTGALNGVALLGVPVKETVDKLSNFSNDIVEVTPNPILHTNLIDSVPMIKADQVWTFSASNGSPLDGTGIKVGVIDTGVDYTHADLGGCFGTGCKVAGGYDFQDNDANPMDAHGHGTHVAATVAGAGIFTPNGGTSEVPILGVAPGATVYAYRVCDSGGACGGSAILSAIQRCVIDNMDVCTISLGAGGGNPDDILSLGVDNAMANGVVFTIAAGNSGPNYGTIGSPGTSRSAITVGAVNKSSQIASFSSRGPVTWSSPDSPMTKPDIVSPGVSICAAQYDSSWSANTCGTGKHVAISGTSMATPHVAGLAALLVEAHPEYSPSQIKDIIKSSAVSLPGLDANTQGNGLIDALSALNLSGVPSSLVNITNLPIIFSDPVTNKIGVFNKTIGVKNTSGNSLTFQTSSMQANGVTTTFNPSTFTLAPNDTIELNVSFNVDHSVVASPQYLSGSIKLIHSGGEIKIGTQIVVKNRLSASVSQIDFGDDNADNSSWTSTKSLSLSSSLTDATDGPYSVSVVCCTASGSTTPAPGLTVTPSQTSVSITPGSSVNLNLTASIPSNSQVPNGNYSGYVTISSSQETKQIPITLFKGYIISVTNTGTLGIRSLQINNTNGFSGCVYPAVNPAVIRLVNDGGPYTVIAQFQSSVCNGASFGYSNTAFDFGTYVLKPNVAAGSNISINSSEANKTIYLRPVRPNGATGINHIAFGLLDQTTGWGITRFDWGGSGYPGFYNSYLKVNNLGPYMEFDASGYDANQTTNSIATYQYQVKHSINSDLSLTNTTSDFGQKDFVAFSNGLTTSPLIIIPSWCIGNACDSFGSGFAGYNSISANSAKLYGYSYVDDIPSPNMGTYYPSTKFGYGVAIDSNEINPLYVTSNYFVDKNNSLTWRDSNTIESVPGTNILIGAGPVFDSTKWGFEFDIGDNLSNFINYNNHFYSFGSNSQEWRNDAVDGTAYIIPQSVPSYTLKKNGVVVSSGTITPRLVKFSLSQYMYYRLWTNEPTNRFSPGDYEFILTRSAMINGVNTQSITKTYFTINNWPTVSGQQIDENPPYIKTMHLLSGGIWQQVIDNSKQNTLSFILDPNPGKYPTSSGGVAYMTDTLGTVTLEQSSDNGSTWSPVTTTQSGNQFTSGNITTANNTSLYTFRITAFDVAGNKIIYQFQIPSGTALSGSGGGSGGGDITPPVVSGVGASNITTTSAVISWTTNEPADSQIMYGTTSGSLTLSFPTNPDTTMTTSHNLNIVGLTTNTKYYYKVRSADAAGNATLSGENNFTTALAGPDSVPPQITITAPTGTTLPSRGNINVSATASDASNIILINIYLDNVLTKQCSNTTSCTTKWNMAKISSGAHAVRVDAYDGASPTNQGTITNTYIKP